MSQPEQPVMYTTTWCGYCRILKRTLNANGFDFIEVDIETTPGAAERVESVNNGNRTVPTVVFADGTALTNPAAKVVLGKQAELVASAG